MKPCARGSSIALVLAVFSAGAASAADPQEYTLDVRGSIYAQAFQRNLSPGVNGAVLETQQLAPFYGYAFMRAENIDLPWAKDALNTELAVWGALGLLEKPTGRNADGDVLSAWVQSRQGPLRVKLGRQVTLPGAARYVRFDGLTVDLRLGGFDVTASAGFVALPRWNRPRGYYVLGTMADALKDPALADQSRADQWLVSARIGWVGTPWLKASLAFHEQHEWANYTTTSAVAFRNVSADAVFTRMMNLVIGGRVVLDLISLAPAEARAFADLSHFYRLPFSIDYSYQSPGLLLPASSILSAFGTAAWHEVGVEATWRPSETFRLVMRGAGQAYADQPGMRASVRAVWSPVDLRTQLIAEVARVGAASNGYTNLRLAVRYRLVEFLTASGDGAVYFYDKPVRDTPYSATAFANLEYTFSPHLRFMLSGSLASTPFAQLDVQVLGRAAFELESPHSGGGL